MSLHPIISRILIFHCMLVRCECSFFSCRFQYLKTFIVDDCVCITRWCHIYILKKVWLSSIEEKERRRLRRGMSSDTTSEYSLINVEVPQLRRFVKKHFSYHRSNNAIQTFDFSIRPGVIGTR